MFLRSVRCKLTMVLVLLTCLPLVIMGAALLYQAQRHVQDLTQVTGAPQPTLIMMPNTFWRMGPTILISILITIPCAWWVASRLSGYLLSHLVSAAQQVAAGVETPPAELAELAPIVGFLRSLMDEHSSLAIELLNAIPVGVILYGSDLKCAYVNQFYAGLLGIPSSEVIGAHYEDVTHRIFPPEELGTRVLPAVHMGQSDQVRQRQTLVGSAGERIPVETVAYHYQAGDGRQGVLCLVHDLRQDEDLARMRKILALVNEAGPIGTVSVNTAGTITDLNPAMTRICALSREKALGQNIGHFFPSLAVEADRAMDFRNQTVSCPCPSWQQDPICPCSHQGHHLVVDGTVTRDGRGTVTGMILIFRDITQLKEMESQLHDALQQAQFLLDALDVGVIAVDQHGRISVCNHTAEMATGLVSAEIAHRDITGLALTPELTAPLLDSLGQGQTHRNHTASWTIDGDKHEFILDCSPLRDSLGKVAGAMTLFRDITVLRKMEHEIQRSEKLAVVGQLAAGTAHEIRNPLTTVRGFLQLLKEKCRQNQWLHEVSYIELMLSEIDRINHVISEFLVLAKDRPAVLQWLQLDGLLRDISAILESEALLRGIALKTELPEQPVSVLGDREQLKQVLLNLATNAFQAMDAGGSLTIAMRCADGRVAVETSDTGRGIQPELLSKIFDPFFTTKDEGTGLGLAICNRIIADHHGEIRVRSTVGEGTTVTVEMPMRGQDSPSPLAPREERRH